jgi:SAM-dependent methyltransferase
MAESGMCTQSTKYQMMSWRNRILGTAFEVIYHNTLLYWLASTIPFLGQWRKWQQLVLPRLNGHDILEVGCGPGWLLADMLIGGYACQAIDASPQMVRAARRTVRRRTHQKTEDIVTRGEVQNLSFPDATFDCVVSTFPTPYIGDISAIREIARVLRPEGRLIIVIGASLLPRGMLATLFSYFTQFVYGGRSELQTSTPEEQSRLFRQVPMESAGLVPELEIVDGPFWRAYIMTGKKSK